MNYSLFQIIGVRLDLVIIRVKVELCRMKFCEVAMWRRGEGHFSYVMIMIDPFFSGSRETSDRENKMALIVTQSENEKMNNSVLSSYSQLIDRLVDQIVKTVHPLRLILFGSAARGEQNSESDLDILVIVDEGTHRRKTAQAIYRSLLRFPLPVDIVVATEEDVRRHQNNFSLVYYNALREGKEVYACPNG